MKTNTPIPFKEKTHEGAPAYRTTTEQELRRSLMSCLLWEKEFYESGQSIAERIRSLVSQVAPAKVAAMAIEAREKMKLRHAPLWVVREMARHATHKPFVASTLARIVQRPDELTEFLSLYWLDKRQPLSKQVKKGLAAAFQKFSAYQLAKYNRKDGVKLKDVLFLSHAKPKDKKQDEDWKRLTESYCEICWSKLDKHDGQDHEPVKAVLPIPGTWENRLSSGEDKKTVWESLITENELGALAFLRNLRNMIEVRVSEQIVFDGLARMKTERVLPFRFIAAAKFAPQWESHIESAMLKCLEGRDKLTGKTVLLIDVSGSMNAAISSKSDLQRLEAANGLAILARELCENVSVYSFSNKLARVPDRHGFALRDAVTNSQQHGGTEMGAAVMNVTESYDRIIVITDEQSADRVPNPKGKGYVINVASNKNGVGYGAWTHIDGWSEAVFDYIQEYEK